MTAADSPKPLMAHLEELRWRLVRMALALAIASGLALIFASRIKDILELPYKEACPDCVFQTLNATEQFSVLMRIALFGGLILASPVVLYQVWAFVSPALNARERRWVIPIVSACSILFTVGVLFGFFTLPRGLGFLLHIFSDVRTDLRMLDYFSFAMRFMLMFGVSFLYPVFLYVAAAMGIVSAPQLAKGRRWALLIIVIVAAAITPTGDALTLTMLSVPLYVLYEATYWVVRLTLRKK